MVSKQIVVDKRNEAFVLYAADNPCMSCASACYRRWSPPDQDLPSIEFNWSGRDLNTLTFFLFGLPLCLLWIGIWLTSIYSPEATQQLTSILVVAVVGTGMLLGSMLARRRGRSVERALKEAISVPTIARRRPEPATEML
jgi:hypothetical protein